jgi:hypothetical protein
MSESKQIIALLSEILKIVKDNNLLLRESPNQAINSLPKILKIGKETNQIIKTIKGNQDGVIAGQTMLLTAMKNGAGTAAPKVAKKKSKRPPNIMNFFKSWYSENHISFVDWLKESKNADALELIDELEEAARNKNGGNIPESARYSIGAAFYKIKIRKNSDKQDKNILNYVQTIRAKIDEAEKNQTKVN